ncbi:Serine/threonine protein kinase [Phytophthora palmivora]|uniref:Serine/threonine protein kinase n=1 Tax=Phytophthora palmivora TaxID=4796 RepID=A0A2P4XKC6_9STRA|nr:Serine/threonine protein kinase [Phytophthora palmivora]
MKTITPAEYTVIAGENIDNRTRLPTTSHEKSTVKIQDHVNKVVSIQDLMEKSHKSNDPSRKTVMFEEVVEARPPPREEKAFLYEEENLPECGVFLPKQVLFKRGKRRVSGATLFSLVHVPSSNNLKPIVETLSTSETSTSSEASTATITSEGQDIDTEAKSPVQVRSKPKAPTLRAVPVEYPSKATFHKGRTTAAC